MFDAVVEHQIVILHPAMGGERPWPDADDQRDGCADRGHARRERQRFEQAVIVLQDDRARSQICRANLQDLVRPRDPVREMLAARRRTIRAMLSPRGSLIWRRALI